ncbi:MAG: polysaccharide deacetylase family protein [Roseiflexus sp.]|nr:polysaccharide deacetylase family protein [Roseiflexus sp.]MCS7288186.1 polysaccharide deacetylase family protein [Roseiflexus sp.]MDW8145994.1 polysaccharide deacetylase family protein [Roseiflexaceae bacterium]MDW8233009.1 polysaccharide deacetylase family protein [Roseiflexaceae bacterium]
MEKCSTSLPLIIITLLTGIALGWFLNDVAHRPPTPLALEPAATPVLPAPTASISVTSTALLSTTPNALLPTAFPVPTVAPTPPTPEPPSTAIPLRIIGYAGHRVAPGETLEQIAERYNSTVDLIETYNRLKAPLRVGRELVVPLLAPSDAGDALLVRRGGTERPWIALTFDAGAGAAPTPRILEALRKRGITITFFLTGRWMRANPDLVRRMVADGHELANHTTNHPDLTTLDDDAIRRELNETEEILQEIAPGATTRPFFRPPYGAYNERVLRVALSEGYLPVYWTLDSLDSVGEPKTPEFLVERVTRKLSPEDLRGAIILAHCGSEATADALPTILDRFAAMGFEVRRLSDVLR